MRAKILGPEPHRRDLTAARPARQTWAWPAGAVEPGRRRHGGPSPDRTTKKPSVSQVSGARRRRSACRRSGIRHSGCWRRSSRRPSRKPSSTWASGARRSPTRRSMGVVASRWRRSPIRRSHMSVTSRPSVGTHVASRCWNVAPASRRTIISVAMLSNHFIRPRERRRRTRPAWRGMAWLRRVGLSSSDKPCGHQDAAGLGE
jgi:hypothetical protein